MRTSFGRIPPSPRRDEEATHSTMRRIARFSWVVVRLSPFLAAFLRDRRRWILAGRPARRTTAHHERRATRLVRTVAALGPASIKLGQMFAGRADILPEPYLSAMGTLRDQVPPEAPDEIVGVIEKELGGKLADLFESFEREPIAAASLGQVHRARRDGRDVAVKVLRPRVERRVALDVDTAFRVVFWLNVLFPNHHMRALANVIREFSVKVREEMDLRIEAGNVRRFQRAFAGNRAVRAPRVFDALATRRVMVMQYVEGTRIDRLGDRVRRGRPSASLLMERLSTVYLRMMMMDGFLHADPHPGNLLVAEDGSLVVLDWGAVVEIPRWTRQSLLRLATAVVREDIDGAIGAMYRLGMIGPEVSRGEIREAAAEIVQVVESARNGGRGDRRRVQEGVREVLDTFYTWPLMLPRELVYLFRTLMLLEGVGTAYDAHFDSFAVFRRVVGAHRGEILRTAGREPVAIAKDVWSEASGLVRSARELLVQAERENLRVRVHPRDVQGIERSLTLLGRRLLLSIFAASTAIISAIVYIPLGSVWTLAAGLLAALALFLIVLVVPAHLLDNPLRHARGLGSRPWRP